jgi:hypothetical protein
LNISLSLAATLYVIIFVTITVKFGSHFIVQHKSDLDRCSTNRAL